MSERSELLELYKRYRAIGRQMNRELVRRIPKRALLASGKRLGFLKKGVLVFDSEDETNILMDYCIHNYREHGPTVIERYLAEASSPAGSDEMTVLQAKVDSHYTLVAVERAEPGFAIHGRDALRGEPLLLTDVSLSQTMAPGAAIATRVVAFPRFCMTGGAPLRVTRPVLDNMEKQFIARFGRERASLRELSPREESALAAICIRCCREGGAGRYIRYDEIP